MERQEPYITTTMPIVLVTYIDDAPNIREYLRDMRRYFIAKEKWAADVLVSLDLQRDFHRQVRIIDELLARMQPDKPYA